MIRAATFISKRFLSRLYSTDSLNLHALDSSLDKWIAQSHTLVLQDSLSADHLADLYITLPTRDGTRHPSIVPAAGQPLNYGHHLAFFHPRNPEAELRLDGTDGDFCPPPPFTRRMWAGGKIKWNAPLIVGKLSTASSIFHSVTKKGFEKGNPMVFVKQHVFYQNDGVHQVAVE